MVMVFFGLEGQVTRMWMEELQSLYEIFREWLVGGAGCVWTNDWLWKTFEDFEIYDFG